MTTEFDEKTFLKAAEHVRFRGRLMEFAKESNRIEGITNAEANERMFQKLEAFLKLEKLTIENVCEFNEWGVLRDNEGLNVMVGGRVRPYVVGYIKYELNRILDYLIIEQVSTPFFVHVKFQKLHPFTDGNGRTGRAIWLWQMVRQHDYDLSPGFLHKWYIQSLEG